MLAHSRGDEDLLNGTGRHRRGHSGRSLLSSPELYLAGVPPWCVTGDTQGEDT